jgi:hypothetical protein
MTATQANSCDPLKKKSAGRPASVSAQNKLSAARPRSLLPEADYAAALAGFGFPEGLAKAIASWDVAASKGALFTESRQLSALIGRPTTPCSVASRKH